jgi:hypothetical protein
MVGTYPSIANRLFSNKFSFCQTWLLGVDKRMFGKEVCAVLIVSTTKIITGTSVAYTTK